MKGPRVSGPWLEYWGGNAIALNCPPIYSWVSLLFPSCGTKFPRSLTYAGDVATSQVSNPSAKHRSRGPESTRSLIKARALNAG